MRPYVIPAGSHRSGLHPNIYFGRPTLFEWEFSMDESCWFNPDMKGGDAINKLCGVSFGFHHKNSIRLGWRPAKEFGRFALFLYYYENGVRKSNFICIVRDKKVYKFRLEMGDRGKLIVSILNNKTIVARFMGSYQNPGKVWGYYLFPYFGGHDVAHRSMIIYLSRKRP